MTTDQKHVTGEDDLRWVHEHMVELEPYEGKWIAVLERRVLTSSEDGNDVVDYLEAHGISGALLFQMPDDVHRKVYLIG
jgi:hypothetical protein